MDTVDINIPVLDDVPIAEVTGVVTIVHLLGGFNERHSDEIVGHRLDVDDVLKAVEIIETVQPASSRMFTLSHNYTTSLSFNVVIAFDFTVHFIVYSDYLADIPGAALQKWTSLLWCWYSSMLCCHLPWSGSTGGCRWDWEPNGL